MRFFTPFSLGSWCHWLMHSLFHICGYSNHWLFSYLYCISRRSKWNDFQRFYIFCFKASAGGSGFNNIITVEWLLLLLLIECPSLVAKTQLTAVSLDVVVLQTSAIKLRCDWHWLRVWFDMMSVFFVQEWEHCLWLTASTREDWNPWA